MPASCASPPRACRCRAWRSAWWIPPAGGRWPPGEVGEFRVKGHVTPGYYRDPEQTRAAFDDDGFFVTGDLGLLGDDGRVRFRGRLKELIKTGGVNVAPLEVEAILLAHPAVKQAYVVGVPDRARGEVGVAAVELHAGAGRRGRRAPRVLPRAPRQLQGAGPRRVPQGRGVSAYRHRQGPEAAAARGARAAGPRGADRLMRAVLCRAWGEVETLTRRGRRAAHAGPRRGADRRAGPPPSTTPTPSWSPGATRRKPPLPFSPGLETAGIVAALRRRRDALQAGRPRDGHPRLRRARRAGGGRRRPRRSPIPAGMDFEEAGAFPIAYISSHVAIRWQGRLEPGETLLVLGAAGGVGLTAVEIGKAMGARVIAGASTAEKLAVARERGADDVVNYATEKLTERVMALTGGKGADVCFDPIGGDLFDAALSVARVGRPHPARRLRGRRAADPRQPAPGQAPRRARLLAALLPLARAGQAARLGRGAAAVVSARASSAAGQRTACRSSAASRRSGS